VVPSGSRTLSGVLVDDPVLPAAAHLTGPAALALLRRTVETFGGTLLSARPCQVHYRPGTELVVRSAAIVRWGDGRSVDETILASTATRGPLPGTVPVTAEHDGDVLEVSVWRWPYDPEVTGLTDAVTPSSVASMCAGILAAPVTLEVRAYRPTERAVVRAIGIDGREAYLKAVRPRAASALRRRHDALRDAGARVPRVLDAGTESVVVMESLTGPTSRDLIRAGIGRWPSADELRRVCAAVGRTDPGALGPRAGRADGRAAHAIRHASMLARVLPDERARLDDLTGPFDDLASRAHERATTVVHGDLHDAQLVVDGSGRITGLLDVDDARVGDPLDDPATVLAHLMVRALGAGAQRTRIDAYAASLRRDFGRDVDRRELDLTTAAVVVGLATGPFRAQQQHWRRSTRRQLDLAQRIIRRAGERTLRIAS
jgi:aminoglycoside phosphotransferase (APT) family kinase protein